MDYLRPENLQPLLSLVFALFAQQFLASPVAAGFALALLKQQLFVAPTAAGFAFAAFAAASGQAGVP